MTLQATCETQPGREMWRGKMRLKFLYNGMTSVGTRNCREAENGTYLPRQGVEEAVHILLNFNEL
jgi:hypothetical protein